MRLFRVEGAWRVPKSEDKSEALTAVERYSRMVQVENGQEGLGVYLQDCMLPLKRVSETEEMPCALTVGALVRDVPLCLVPASGAELRRANATDLDGRPLHRTEALVHVCLPRTKKHTLAFLSSCFGERVLEGRPGRDGDFVIREHLPLGDAAGVEAVAMSDDGQEALIHMIPNASFRVHALTEASYGQKHQCLLIVTWNGLTLDVTPPKHYPMHSQPRHRRRRAPDRVQGGLHINA